MALNSRLVGRFTFNLCPPDSGKDLDVCFVHSWIIYREMSEADRLARGGREFVLFIVNLIVKIFVD